MARGRIRAENSVTAVSNCCCFCYNLAVNFENCTVVSEGLRGVTKRVHHGREIKLSPLLFLRYLDQSFIGAFQEAQGV
jgi:hypothetical protein